MALKIVSPEFFKRFEFYACTWTNEKFIICVIPKPWFLEMGRMNEILFKSLEPQKGLLSDKWEVTTAYGIFYAASLQEFKNKIELKRDDMSLTVLLLDPESKYEPSALYSANITHNLTDMAEAADLYKPLWRPEEMDASYANEIQEDVEKGLNELLNKPEYFKRFNSPNGWGLYKHFVPFVENYLEAIKNYPEAEIYVIR